MRAIHWGFLPTALLLTLLTGCNHYELFRLAGYVQASFSNEADILFVVDNSPSMYDESSSLALNFTTFVDQLVDPRTGSAMTTDDLSDAVQNYISYVTERGRFLDYQLAVTTTTAEPDPDVAGSAGELVGEPPVISESTTSDVATAFQQAVLCEATCWPERCTEEGEEDCIPFDPDYECGDDPGDQVSWEYLHCVCGEDWEAPPCGAGTEEGFEATLQALCRAVENPPAACYDEESPFTEYDVGTNAGMLRDGSAVIVVIVTDEGDSSRRLTQGEEDPQLYLDLFDQFDLRLTFAVIGPDYDPETRSLPCNSGGATTWGSLRYQLAAERTGGFYDYIEAEDEHGECRNTDFAVHLENLGELLNNLLNVFPLQSVPDPDTIVVFVDGEEVPETSCEGNDEDSCGDGWTYDPADNAVAFHGAAIPDYNADVQIFYRPLAGMPRSLPF